MTTEALACTHWWVISPPNGPTCEGVCKFCGKKRVYKSAITEDTLLAGRRIPSRSSEAEWL